MRVRRYAFTLTELITVILMIAILAAITLPFMQARLDRGKWTEANTGAGMIRRAVKARHVGTGQEVTGALDDPEIQKALDIHPRDLVGTYFGPADYHIVSVSDDGFAVVQVTGSRSKSPSGSKILAADGTWRDAGGPVEDVEKPMKKK